MDATVSVLHVDDDGALLDIAATFLERADARIEVTTETDPTVVPRRVREESFDCVVSDYNMPGMDGLDLLRRLQRTHPDLPFVLFTGTDDASVGVEALEVGATDFCRKQVGTDHYRILAARIVDTVERQREHERLTAELERLRERVAELERAAESQVTTTDER